MRALLPVTFALAFVVNAAPAAAQADTDQPRSERPALTLAKTTFAEPQRPAALPAMYVGLGALNAMDLYSTSKAMKSGAYEANPLMPAGQPAMAAAFKAVTMAGSIYAAEKMWKKNRKGAIVMMAVINGATALVVNHNMRNARR